MPTPLTEAGDAIEIRVKTTKGFLCIIDASGNNRAYFRIGEGENGCFLNGANGKAVYATADSELFGTWLNLLIIYDDGGFSIYYKTDDITSYKLFLKTDSKWVGSCGGIYFEDVIGTTYVDSILVYRSMPTEPTASRPVIKEENDSVTAETVIFPSKLYTGILMMARYDDKGRLTCFSTQPGGEQAQNTVTVSLPKAINSTYRAFVVRSFYDIMPLSACTEYITAGV